MMPTVLLIFLAESHQLVGDTAIAIKMFRPLSLLSSHGSPRMPGRDIAIRPNGRAHPSRSEEYPDQGYRKATRRSIRTIL